jgi:hypothetical protein
VDAPPLPRSDQSAQERGNAFSGLRKLHAYEEKLALYGMKYD